MFDLWSEKKLPDITGMSNRVTLLDIQLLIGIWIKSLEQFFNVLLLPYTGHTEFPYSNRTDNTASTQKREFSFQSEPFYQLNHSDTAPFAIFHTVI